MIRMKFSKVKKEISRIAKIESPEDVKGEVIWLDTKLNKEPKIKIIKRGNYYYFYRIEYFWNSEVQHGREDIKEALGQIHVDDYKKDEEQIERFSYEELIEYLNKDKGGE